MHLSPANDIQPPSSGSGILYVVATPIGNLEDITFRAVRILKEVDLIAAEDTRHSRILLTHYQISARLESCHEHNEKHKIPFFLDLLAQGKNLALISDAGTPGISDPGYLLVQAACNKGFQVMSIPGCNAAAAGLSISGLPTDQFHFLGFLARKQGRQIQALEDAAKFKER